VVERLFTEDAHYRASPYEESEVGHDAIKAFWLNDVGEVFTAAAEPSPSRVDRRSYGLRCVTVNLSSRNTATSGCSSLPTTAACATSRNRRIGRASRTQPARSDDQIRLTTFQ